MTDLPDEPLRIYRSRGITGGLNTWAHSVDIGDNETVELKNVTTATPGLRQKRNGTTIVATGITAGPIYGIGAIADKLLVVSAGEGGSSDHKRLWLWDGTTSTFSYVGALTGYTANGLHKVSQLYDASLASRAAVILPPEGNTAVSRWYYDGSSLAQAGWGTGANPPAGPDFEFFMNYGFAIGTSRSSTWVSNIAAPLATGFLNTVNQFIMGGESNNKIVALKGFRSSELVVFMTDRIEELIVGDALLARNNASALGNTPIKYSGTGGIGAGNPQLTFSRRVIDTTVGCASRYSVAKVSEDLIFADQRGNIRSLARTALDASQGTKSLPISIKIQSYIDRINGTALDQICAAAYDRFYVVGFPLDSSTSPSHVFVFDTVRGAWDGPWTGINPKCFKTLAVSASAAAAADKFETLYAGTSETTEGRVVRLYRGTSDFGSAIDYQETTKQIYGDSLELDKTWRRIEITGVATADVTLTIEANVDDAGWVNIGTMSLLGASLQLPFPLPQTLGGSGLVRDKFSLEALQRGRAVQFRFTESSTSAVKFLGYTLFYNVENFEWED